MPRSRFRGFGSTGKEDAGGGRDIWSTPGLDHNLRMSRLMSDRGTRVPDDVLAAPRSMTLILRSPARRAGQVPPRTLADTTAHYDSPHQSLGQSAAQTISPVKVSAAASAGLSMNN